MRRVPVDGRRGSCLGLFTLLAFAVIIGSGRATPAHAATTITVDCAADPSALAGALASANDGDTLAIQGTCKGTFEISHSLTLAGSAAATLNGQGAGTVLTVDSANTVALNNVTITDGNGSSAGGILNNGTLTLTSSTVSGNSATPGTLPNFGGGGIFNQAATLTLTNSTVSENSVNVVASGRNGVGGILSVGGSLTVTNSSVSGNSATSAVSFTTAVGGISIGGFASPASLTLTNSTVSGNSADALSDAFGGIIDSGPLAVATVTNSTVSGNSASATGGASAFSSAVGGVSNSGGSLSVMYSTLSGNNVSEPNGGFLPPVGGLSNFFGGVLTAQSSLIAGQSGPNCYGFAADSDGGYNLDDGTSCGFSSANHSLSSTNPLLDPAGLQDNSGPTQTIALEPGSPAIDAIPSGVNGCGTTITTDQRGVSRPQGSGCDIGAFELVPPGADVSISKSGAPNPVVSGNRLTYTLTVTNNGPQEATGVTVRDTLPGSPHFNTVSSSQGTCTRSTTTNPKPKDGTVTCSVGNLANGAKASITIVVTATKPGTLTNTAKVSGNETDPDPSNNSATATTTVVGT